MLRKFNISVNGTKYVVEMEEIGGVPVAQAPVAQAVVQAPVEQAAPVAAPAPAPTVDPSSVEGFTMEAPMPGTILEVDVKVGDVVAFEQRLVVLEAMKMENDLVAPHAGTVVAVHVQKGDAIDVGQAIVTIGTKEGN